LGIATLEQGTIADSNAAIGLDTIEFDNNLSGQQITLTSGELQITDNLTINGLGVDFLTISGNNADRVFLVDDGDGSNGIDVTLDSLTITEGNGGGIRNRETLTVLNSNISNNIGTGIISTSASLTVGNSNIANNTGSGISGSRSNLNVSNSTISNNLFGIGNDTGGGEITQSEISGNTSGGLGFSLGSLILTDSIIANNNGTAISGGRVNVEIDNSIISGNSSTGDGGAINPGLFFSANITNSRITNNTADSDGDGNGNGGGIFYPPFAGITLTNTIVADNLDNSPEGSEQHPDISGRFSSDGYNLIGNPTGIPNSAPANFPTDLFGTGDNPLGLSDVIEGTSGSESLAGTSGIDRIEGGDGNDTLRGRGDIDQLLGEAGDDRLIGGDGDDILSGSTGNDTLNGGADNDRLFGEADNDRLVGGDGNDLLDGGDGNDNLNGNNGHDQLFGEAGDDRLSGGDGDDILDGGTGRDVLIGDAGSDRFMIVSRSTSDRDIIRDYEDGIDRLVLTGDLSFNDLTISQSGADTRIRETATNQTLAILSNTDINDINQHDFEFGIGENGLRVEAEDYVGYHDTTAGNTGILVVDSMLVISMRENGWPIMSILLKAVCIEL